MNILITGDRRWNDTAIIERELGSYNKDNDTIHHYINTGATLFGKVVAAKMGFKTEAIIEDGNLNGIDLILAFHNYIQGSRQTLTLLAKAQQLNIPHRVIGKDKV